MTAGATDHDEWVLADAFDRAAPTYDSMVGLSPGYHAQLTGAAGALVEPLAAHHGDPNHTTTLLDLGCGSGASTSAMLQSWTAAGGDPARLTVTGVDASTGMVAQARRKPWAPRTTFVVSDAVAHLANLETASVDGILASYLLRNVPDREKLVTEMVRVLRPGGTLVVHDYSVAGSRRARATWAVMVHAIVIPLAVLKRSDVELHRYLYRSVRDFDSVQRICERMLDEGLTDVRHRTYPGVQSGLVHTVVGNAPA
ncbi:MAG: class I SAM-dependent methyltransferase [Ornithinibacter sp.]